MVIAKVALILALAVTAVPRTAREYASYLLHDQRGPGPVKAVSCVPSPVPSHKGSFRCRVVFKHTLGSSGHACFVGDFIWKNGHMGYWPIGWCDQSNLPSS